MKKILFGMILMLGSLAMAKPYGEAGCGLGSVIFGNEAGSNQIFASITNYVLGDQTFGISSGTSNCVDDGKVASGKEVPMYIEVNKLALAKDAARGQGETLAGLSQIMGCKEQATLGTALKGNYESLFDSKTPANEITDGIITIIKNNESLNTQCGLG